MDKYKSAVIIVEQYKGTAIDRPTLDKLINDLKQCDTLVVTKLDRLARNAVEEINIIQRLFNRGIGIHVINIGLLENTSIVKSS